MILDVKPMDNDGWIWFNEHCPVLAVEDSCGLVAFDKGERVAGFVMDNFTENSLQGHFVVLNPLALRHKFFHICASYVFEELGKSVFYALVPGDNEKAIKLNLHFGFTEKCRFEGAFKKGVDYVIMELKKENCTHLLDEVA